FIQWPFIIEGLIIGLVGALVSVVLLKVLYAGLAFKLQQSIPFLPLVFKSSQLSMIYIIVGLVGTILGILGAYLSVKKTLKSTI
ncbi:MAG: ABC transporter permease, partial [Candidatus Margulisbacteria bacterium]|nr:ABC transporter permease [Candidatus Margulisiibacteriota bacterium]